MAVWPSNPGEELIRLFRGYWVSRAIYVAAELGIARISDLLGPKARDLRLGTRGAGIGCAYAGCRSDGFA